ncbi:hypothetical protein [Antribacter gilvus]|uniref:hypothetical protein n=1 Tax=Antribacter gilvus TaxID=2304675 RepID=UPI0013DFE1D2|nr:hypothetical protein [Antribacter gilvus]
MTASSGTITFAVQSATERGTPIPGSQTHHIDAQDFEDAVRRFLRRQGIDAVPTHVPDAGVWQAQTPTHGSVFVRAVRTRPPLVASSTGRWLPFPRQGER